MPEGVGEKCGVAAVSLPKPGQNAMPALYKLMLRQQNRGQLSSGVSTFRHDRPQILATHKKNGLVNQLFACEEPGGFEHVTQKYAGPKGIGHVRYATFGADHKALAQPFMRTHGRRWKWFSFAFNGNLANYATLKRELDEKHFHFIHHSDTELMMHYFAREMRGDRKSDLSVAFSMIAHHFDGAYNTVFLNAEGELAVARDPWGFRPLNTARRDDGFFAASESIALTSQAFDDVRALSPGEMVLCANGSAEKKRFAKKRGVARCMFEFVYFSDVCSEFDGRSVYDARWQLGIELARAETRTMPDAVVVPVPETSKVAAQAYAQTLGLPYREGLITNRALGRTFIETKDRGKKVREKFFPVKTVLNDQRVILVDDSIVRGNTLKNISEYLRNTGGVREVHVRISCPPISHPCFYGIDMSTYQELIAARQKTTEQLAAGEPLTEKQLDAVRREINADSLVYQTPEGLLSALGFPRSEVCMACINGKYPTAEGCALKKKSLSQANGNARSYE